MVRAGVANPAPPVDDFGDVGGDSGWVPLTKARGDIDAHLLAGRLDASGVETSLVRDFGAPGTFLHGGSNPWAPVTIFVKQLQLEDAQLVLAEISLEGPAVEPHDALRKRPRWSFVSWWLIALLSGLVLTLLTVLGTASGNSGSKCEIPIVCGRD